MKAGDNICMTCDQCSVEFEVVYEPKAKTDKESAKSIVDNAVCYCPFCGNDVEDIEDDEEPMDSDLEDAEDDEE